MPRLAILILLSVGLLISVHVSAQEDSCPAIVQEAIQTTDAACADTGRNELCYGNIQIEATPQTDVVDFQFTQTGDTVPVTDLHTLHLYPFDAIEQAWGIALMRIQANIPDSLPGQNVTFVVFGDVEIENAGTKQETRVTLPVTTISNTNVRGGPATDYAIVGSLAGGEVVEADGRLADSTWLRVRLPDFQGAAWVYMPLVTADDNLDRLTIVDPAETSAARGPMQAFYFRSGIGESPCAEASASGILIQTPRQAGQIAFTINGLEFAFGSTVYLYGEDGTAGPISTPDQSPFGVALLDGKAEYPGGALHPGQAQAFTWDGTGYTASGDPYAFDATSYAYLPVGLLPERVDIPQRAVFTSQGWDIVTNSYPPSPQADSNGCAAILLHNAGLDKSSWQSWLVPELRDAGWWVWAPDMPGHGETGGSGNWGTWLPIVNDAVNYLQREQHLDCGLMVGSSIGANVALHTCAAWPEWCQGAVLLSPGLDFGGYGAPYAMSQVTAPVYMATSQNDTRGGDANVARQIAGDHANVTVNIYDGDKHGSFLAEDYPLGQDILNWWAQQ